MLPVCAFAAFLSICICSAFEVAKKLGPQKVIEERFEGTWKMQLRTCSSRMCLQLGWRNPLN